ncbi:MAG TPA: VCBS repeat-containing protein [Tepidisphaeraceae bacterium]|nr:VCBS repeat-containing protein [Tepidisphaeraceae bacterium]
MGKTLALVALILAVSSVGCLHSQKQPPQSTVKQERQITWKKIVLSDKFYSEGANFGDFNHDGHMGVVAGPYWYEGPDFSPEKRHEYMPVQSFKPDNDYSHNFFAFTYDFNGDGWDDILIIGFPGQDASWYENPKGKEGHWVRHQVYDEVDDESPTFGDLLKDGKPVIVCCSHGYMGYVQPDYSDPAKPWKFHPITPHGNYQRFTHGIGFGDVNGDGRNDILEAHGWWEQPPSLMGDPVWKKHEAKFFDNGHGDGGSQMYAYDVNGDGRNDVVCSLQAHGNGLAWFEQMPDGSFKKHLIMGSKPSDNAQGVTFSQLHAVDLVDVNGDGLMDIVTGKRYFAHGSHGDIDPLKPPVLYWFELKRDGDGKAHYIAHEIDNDSGVGTQVVAKRIDGQKIPSIVVGNKKGTFVFVPQEQ